MKNNAGMVFTYNEIIGSEYIIVPWSDIKTRDDALELAKDLNIAGEKCRKAGFKFAYHNHAFEFVKDGGEYLLDIVFNNVDKSNVTLELDVFWAAHAGLDPLAYYEKNKDIIKLLHLKQLKDMETKKDADLGDGMINFESLIKAAVPNGVEHYVLEQEAFDVSPRVSAENGYKHIMSL